MAAQFLSPPYQHHELILDGLGIWFCRFLWHGGVDNITSCQMLMTGQGSQTVADTLAGRYGADPGQSAAVVRIAHGILCTSARG